MTVLIIKHECKVISRVSEDVREDVGNAGTQGTMRAGGWGGGGCKAAGQGGTK